MYSLSQRKNLCETFSDTRTDCMPNAEKGVENILRFYLMRRVMICFRTSSARSSSGDMHIISKFFTQTQIDSPVVQYLSLARGTQTSWATAALGCIPFKSLTNRDSKCGWPLCSKGHNWSTKNKFSTVPQLCLMCLRIKPLIWNFLCNIWRWNNIVCHVALLPCASNTNHHHHHNHIRPLSKI